VGSANFTDRGQKGNFEAGVLLDDARFARAFLHQWESAVSAGLFVQAQKA
jgi:phosphatidylserine/phosphatidylglycerophosphate/cardiolipin synthase-like enzyme